MTYCIKIRKVGGKSWKFLSSGGSMNRLRIHALQFRSKADADMAAAEIRSLNSEYNCKVEVFATDQAGTYEVFDLSDDESQGHFETLDEARGCVRFNKLKAYAIWHENVRIECCDPYEGDDDRVKQGLGQANASERES